MSATFAYDMVRSSAALARMKRARDGVTGISGEDWAHGAMGALIDAEFLAAQAGIVPWVQLPTGERGLFTVGAARDRIGQAPKDVKTIYLATHGLVRSTHALAKPRQETTPLLEGLGPLGALPAPDTEQRVLEHAPLGDPTGGILIALTIVAVAAVIGTAWYYTQKANIEVDGRNLRTTALISELSSLARTQLAQTGQIDPGVWKVFEEIARSEEQRDWMPWAVGGLVLVGAGVGAYAWWRHRQQQHSEGARHGLALA